MLLLVFGATFAALAPEPSPELRPGWWAGVAEVGSTSVETYRPAMCLERPEPALMTSMSDPRALCKEVLRERAADGSWRGRLECSADEVSLNVDTLFRPDELSTTIVTSSKAVGPPPFTIRMVLRREGSCPAKTGSAPAAR